MVHVTTPRSLGNFKTTRFGAGCVCKILDIQKTWSFQLKRLGTDTMIVSIKKYMHFQWFIRLSTASVFEGTALWLFKGGNPTVEDASLLKIMQVNADVTHKLKMRYKTLHSRVDALFSSDGQLDDSACFIPAASHWVFSETCTVSTLPLPPLLSSLTPAHNTSSPGM